MELSAASDASDDEEDDVDDEENCESVGLGLNSSSAAQSSAYLRDADSSGLSSSSSETSSSIGR